jgi:two-component system, OmpR family, sensor histidine kinase KdpD
MAGERGKLKVFIGLAPGVGKTYRMLQEGVAEAESGRDVAIGYLEPHGRDETVAQADGLETIPRREVDYRGKPLEEMDLPAVLARRPELCLIDELAHTNAPGVEHEKRYEDVRDVLDAGIDVFSTVNVQHLESLNDQVTQLTGALVRETIPDEVLSAADEVVLIDLTPEALIARLRAGKVYRPERVQAALNNFFKIENLSALRETALRQVAEDVEVKRLIHEPSPIVRRDEEGVAGALEPPPQAIAERLLALVTLAPDSERVVRRAWRSAQRLDAVLDVLVVRPTGRPPSPQDRKRLEALRRLVAMLGARLRVEEGDDVAAAAVAAARELGSTYVLMGSPRQPRGLGRLGIRSGGDGADVSVLTRLLRELPGVDVRIVADPTLRGGRAADAAPAPEQSAD